MTKSESGEYGITFKCSFCDEHIAVEEMAKHIAEAHAENVED